MGDLWDEKGRPKPLNCATISSAATLLKSSSALHTPHIHTHPQHAYSLPRPPAYCPGLPLPPHFNHRHAPSPTHVLLTWRGHGRRWNVVYNVLQLPLDALLRDIEGCGKGGVGGGRERGWSGEPIERSRL